MEELGPIIEPTLISNSYDTLGWVILQYAATAIGLILIFYRLYHYYKNAFRRAAIRAVQNCSDVRSINVVLKSLAIQAFDRQVVASLSGEKWIVFLMSKLKKTHFQVGQLSAILEEDWTGIEQSELKINEFRDFSNEWIKNYDV